MESPITHLRPLQGVSGGVYVSDIICSFLLPVSLGLSNSPQTFSLLSLALSVSSVLVFFLDYRGSGESGGFAWVTFLPAWACVYLMPEITTSRFKLYLTFWTVLLFRPLFNKIIQTFNKSFTFGEGCLVCQGLLLTMFKLSTRIYRFPSYKTVYIYKQLAKWLNWFVDHCSDPSSKLLITSWVVLSVLSVVVVVLYKHMTWPVNTKTRKIFHLSIILVYIPGLLYDPTLLYTASVGATILFIAVEFVRWSGRLTVLTAPLSGYLSHFVDSKEGGSLILTNIYLLVGVSMPLWVWPGNLNVPAPLPLYAGVLSVGIGDAASSIFGSCLGRTHFLGSRKTLEGALAGFLCQLGAGVLITHLAGLPLSLSAFSSVCLATSLFELCVDQVDNLTLPLVMYSALQLCDWIPINLSLYL